jgi:hypothetical protein
VHAVLITTNTEVGVKEHKKKRDNTTSTYQVYKDGIHPGDLLEVVLVAGDVKQ